MPAAGSGDSVPAVLDFAATAGYGAAMSTDARRMARRYYLGSGRSLEDDMAALAANPQGVVAFLPGLVALMKPVESARPESWMELARPAVAADAWYIHLLVGDLAFARRLGQGLAAYPWLCFQRGARNATLHRWRWSRLVPTMAAAGGSHMKPNRKKN